MTLPSVVVGGLLAGRYRLCALVAVGGMGEVWRAEDVLLGRTVAVKTLKPEYVRDEDFRARFRAEARHAGGLAHPGIASVYDFGELPDQAWLVMELVDGEPLSSLLRREGVLSPDRTLDLLTQTAAALQVAHEGGVVHRDIKPGNLLVRPDGVVKVTDFGIASAVDAAPLTLTGEVVGTAYYLSPEQARGQGAGPASDLYSLGVVAYECLAGVRPFAGDNAVAVAMAHLHAPVPALPDSVPEPLRALVARLLSKDPADRGSSAAELSAHASALRDGATRALPVLAGPSAGAPRQPRQPHRRAVRSAAVLLSVLALGLGLRTGLAPDQTVVPAIAAGQPQAQAPVRVRAEEWIGRPATEVRDALTAIGLAPRLVYDGADRPVDTVSAVEPVGDVAAGTPVVLHVVPAPRPGQPPGAGEDKAGDDKAGDDKKRGKRP